MPRPEVPVDPEAGPVEQFACDLRSLRRTAGNPSYRSLSTLTHYSAATLAAATSGRQLPSLGVLLAFVSACGGDPTAWRERWHLAQEQRTIISGRTPRPDAGREADPGRPPEDLVDGADPDASGCGRDAMTVHACKIVIPSRRLVLGQVQLRYSPRGHAMWARFEGFASLDHIAPNHHTEIEVATVRLKDETRVAYRDEYAFDYHWSDVLLAGLGPIVAEASVYLDGDQMGSATTRPAGT